MASSPKQENRTASLTTPLGADKLVLTRFEAHEGISELFEITVDALSDDANIDFGSIIGAGCSLKINSDQKVERHFHGRLAEAEWMGMDGYRHAYRLVLRPWPWLLSHTGNCRIFENKKVDEIIEKVFQDQGFSDFRFDLSGGYPTIEYCVQYRESDLHFALRLLEENGIYYYFEHTDSKHSLVMIDRASVQKTVPNLAKVLCDHTDSPGASQKHHIMGWRAQRRFTTGKSMYSEYDYLAPKSSLSANQVGGLPFTHGKLEFYDYPGRYTKRGDGQRMVTARQEGFEAMDQRRYSGGVAPPLLPGYKVTVEKNPVKAENGAYLVVSCRHTYEAEAYRSGGGGGGGYAGAYEFIPADLQFRAPMTTEKPRISSSQTAKVVGRQGEEIDVDEHGRIQVEFYWDRDKTASRRVRVAQIWAGKNWGGIVIPRIGMEVVVTFLEGDPDQPLVIGTVYNADNKPPYDLPANKNISGVKSESTKGGSGYNEFIFDDTKNQEKIRTHAEKDLEVTVDNTETRTIKGEHLTSPKGTYARKTVIEKGDEILEVATGHRDEKIKQGNDTLTIGMGNRACEISMGNDDLTLKMGNRTTKLKLGKDFTEALQSITLKVLSSKVVIDPMGVTIEGPMIKLKATGMIQTNAPLTNISSDAVTIVKGAVVMIN